MAETDTPHQEPQRAKSSRPKKPTPAKRTSDEPITVRWELAELPSSQHKAGLAGLAICVEAYQRREDRRGICEITNLDSGGLTLHVDRIGMQGLFDDIYAASLEEQEREKPLINKAKVELPPKRTEERLFVDKKGVEKKRTFYVYEQTVPRGALIEEWDSASAGPKKLWLKLWRDLVWTTLRGVPATREPYECRAEKRVASDGGEAWDDLARDPLASVPLPSTYFLGAQATTADAVPIKDVVRLRLLLHFWPFVVPIYVPSIVDRDGNRDFIGYALVVPDIADLQEYVVTWPSVARERSAIAAGYRPRDAVIDVAAEGGLDFARRMRRVLETVEGSSLTAPLLNAVDVFHIEKEGNNVRVRSVSRMDLARKQIDEYARIRDAYWTTTFRRQRIMNVLEDREWWFGFGRLAATTPEALTIGDNKYQRDCRVAFMEVEMAGTPEEKRNTLEGLVYDTVRSYVFGRLDRKYGLRWADVADVPAKRSDYEEKKEKVAREAFLAVRSRTGRDFVAYFTSTICSVSQRLNEREFLEVARALHDDSSVERVRSLTLLALSAHA